MFDIEKVVAKFTDFIPFENHEDYDKLNSEEKKEYDYRLKIYRDWRNIIDTSYRNSKIEGRKKQKDEGIINALKMGMFSMEIISELFEVSVEYILKIKEENNL